MTYDDKKAQKYICKNCDYISHNFSHFKRHLQTIKHKKRENDDINDDILGTCPKKLHSCICGKAYKHRQGLSVHRKTCSEANNVESLKNEINELKRELISKTTLENAYLKEQLNKKDEQIQELLPKVGGNNITFNINTFLNKDCKDAISLQQFIKNVSISVENLLLINSEGISHGISNIILEHMNKLALHERPIHCSDKKREILYVKNETWEKDKDKRNTKDMISKVYSKQMKSINKLADNTEVEFDVLVGKCTSDLNEKKVIKELCDSFYVKDDN